MGNQKSKDRLGAKKDGEAANAPTEENGSRRFPSYHLPFQQKKKKKSSTIKRLMSIFNRKRNANKKKIRIKQDDVPNAVNSSGLFLGHKSSNGSNASYCSPYLLLQEASNDPLANYWPPLLHSHLSLINKGDDEQLSKINIFDMDEMEDQEPPHSPTINLGEVLEIQKISQTRDVDDEELLESIAIHEVYSSFIQQAKEKKVTPKEDEPPPQPPVSSSASRSRSSSSGGTGEAVTCSSGSSAAEDFEDACSSLVDRKDNNRDVVDVLKSIEELSVEEPIQKVNAEQTLSEDKAHFRRAEITEETAVNIPDSKLSKKQNLEMESDTTGGGHREKLAVETPFTIEIAKVVNQTSCGNTEKTSGNIKMTVVKELSPTILPKIEEIKEKSPQMMPKIEEITEQPSKIMPQLEEIKEQSAKIFPKIEEIIEQSSKMPKFEGIREKSPKIMPKIEEMKEQLPKPLPKTEIKEQSPKIMPKIEINELSPKIMPKVEGFKEQSPKQMPKIQIIKDQSSKLMSETESIKEQSLKLMSEIEAIKAQSSQLLPKIAAIKEQSPPLLPKIVVIVEEPPRVMPKIEVTSTNEDEAPEISSELVSMLYDDVEPSAVTCEECQLMESHLAEIDEFSDARSLPKVVDIIVKVGNARVSPNHYENLDINTNMAIESEVPEVALTDDRSSEEVLVADTHLKVENVNINVEDVERSENGQASSFKEPSGGSGKLAKARRATKEDESSISLSDGDKESSCDGSESSVMDIGDDIWDDDESVETVAEAAVSIKTKLVLDLLNHSEVDMEDFNAFLNLPCPLEEKYQFLQVQKLFDANQIQDSGNLDELGRCFRVLSRYGLDLLKPIEERPMYWKKILLPSETPKCRWLSVLGAQEILQEFGYQRVESGLIYPEGEEPDSEAVAAWVVELLLAAHELSCFSLQAHPQPDFFKQSLTCTASSDNLPQILKDEPPSLPSTSCTHRDIQVDTEESLFDALKKSSSAPLISRETEEESEMIGRRTLVPWLTPGKENSRPLPHSPSPVSPVVTSAQSVGAVGVDGHKSPSFQRCHLCGSSSPAVRCEKCSNLIFCLSCDDMYHRHPKRRDHVRKLAQRPAAAHTSPPPRPPPKCTDLSSPPVPPPRRRKSQLSAPSSPVTQRKNEQKVPDLPKKQFPLKFGSLKKLLPTMHGRPAAQLPPQSPSTQQPQPEQRFQPRQFDLIDRKHNGSNGHRQIHSPMGRNYEEWMSHPMDQSSSDVDEEEDGRSTGTSSGGRGGGGYGYPMDDLWPPHLRPPRYTGAANSRSMATLERQPNHQSTLLRHHNSFAGPSTGGPYVKRDNPFFYHPTNINHSTSVMDLSYPHNIGYPLPQVQSMSEGLDYAGSIAPCGCHPTWIGPDQFGVWIPPSRCPMHNTSAAMYPPPPPPPQPHPNSPHVIPPPWGYPQPYMPSTSPPPPPPPQPSKVSQTQNINGNKTSVISSPPTSHHSKNSSSKRDERKSTLQSSNGKRHGLSSSSDEKEEVDHEEYYSPSEEEERRWQEEHLRPNNKSSLKSKTLQKSAEIKKEPPLEKLETKDEQWECEHCTFLNDKETRICGVCCKTRGLRRSPSPPATEPKPSEPKPLIPEVTSSATTTTTKTTVHQEVIHTPKTILKAPSATEEIYEEILNPKVPKSTSAGTQCAEDDLASVQPKAVTTETSTEVTPKEVKPILSPPLVKHVTSTGTSPPPQTISTQTPVDMWSSDEEEEEDERVLRSPSPSPQPPSSTSNPRRRRGRRDSSLLRRAASLQMVNRDRKFSTSSREKEDRTSHTGGWYQDSVRRASSRASLRDTSPSPPPVIASRNKRWSSYAQRRTSAYEPRAGYSSKEEEPGDDEYDVDDDDDTQSSMSKSRKDYYLSLEELVNRRRSKNVKNQGIEILRLVKEAERANFNAEDLQVAIHQCGLSEPVQWLRDNWKTMIDTVTTLASRKDNGIGAVSSAEAKDALRVHKGNIWAAVTDCIETRQKKVKELLSRSGNLSREEVTAALTASAGDVEEAALQMNKTSLKPFLMRIYGPPTGIENEAGAIRNLSSTSTSGVKRFHELFDKPQAESYGNPEDSCSEGSSYLMEGDGQLDDEEMSYLDNINPNLIKELDAQIEMKSGQIEFDQQGIKEKNRNESEILQVKSNHKTHLEKQALLNNISAIQIDSHRITNDKHTVTENVHEFVTEKREAQAENSKITTEKQEVSREHCKVPKENTKIPVENHEVPKEKHEIPVGKYEIPVEMIEIPVEMNEIPVEKYEVPVEKCEVLKEDSKVTVVKQEVQMPKCKVSKERCDITLEKREVSEKKHEVPVERCEVPMERCEVPMERCEVPMEKTITVENHEVSKVQHKVLMEKHEVPIKNKKLTVEEHEVPMEKCAGNKNLELPTQNQSVQMVNRNEAKESDTISQEICEASHEHDSHMVNCVNTNANQRVPAKIDNAEKMNELPTDRCEVSNDCDDIRKEISSIQEEDRVVSDKSDNDHVISEGRHDTLQTTQNAPNMKTGMVSDEQEVSQIKQEVQTAIAQTVNHTFDMDKLGHENINENLKSESVTIVEMNKPQVARRITNMQMSNENEVDTYVKSASTKCEHQYQEVDLFEVENASADVPQNEGAIKNETPDISQSEEIGIKNDTVTDKHVNIQNDMLEQSSMDSAEVEPCCTQSEVFYDAFPDPIYEPAVAKLIQNNNPVRFISQSQVRHTSTLNVTMSQQMPSTAIVHQPQHSQPIDKTAAVIVQQGKPEVIVKTLFVRTGIPTVMTNRLESVSELVAPELAEAVELIEYASTLTEDLFVITSNVDSGHNYMNKNDYQLLLPVETRFAEVVEAVMPLASVIPEASTSQIKPTNQPASVQVQSALKGKAVIPLATAEHKASTSQTKTSNQQAVVQVPLAVKEKAVVPLASVAPEASTSQIKPSNQPAIVQVPLAVKGKAVIPLASVEPMDSTSQIKPSNQPAIVEVQSAVKAKAVDEFLPPAKEDTDDSSAVPSSASELGQTETEDDDDEDEVEPMEPPLPVKPDLGRRARQFLAEGKLPNYYKAELAVKLLDLRFEESEAIFAANECSDLYMAVSYLQQDCELCAGRFPMGKMISMLNCVHRCCRACAKDYFTLKIKERNILETGCPFCCEPDLSDDEVATLYFNHLDIMLKNLVEADVHELFQRKLRDRALMNEPNFRWCDKCGSGFIGDPNRRRIVCPDCKVITCGHCNKPWEKQHEGISCQQFEEWRLENDPEYQKQGLESYLAENGIHCPKCKFKYDLAKGGCMHFTCSQCKFEFCSGCGKAFRMAGKCLVSQRCEKLGLHAHHPRNCLFYLRDKDPEELKKLLDEHHIKYDEGDDGSKQSVKCAVLEQREIPDGHEDAVCGREVEAKQAGLCRMHYIEYLGGLLIERNIETVHLLSDDDLEFVIRNAGKRLPPSPYPIIAEKTRIDMIEYLVSLVGEHKVDPVSIMDGAALEQELRRKEKKVPERKPGELPEEYREVLVKVVLKEIPLEDTEVPYLARRPSKIVT